MQEPHELWHHEDNLINQRNTWLLASQSLLMAAYGLIVKNAIYTDAIIYIPYVGLITSSAILLGIIAAISSQLYLIYKYGKLYVWMPATIIGWFSGVTLPASFVFAWYMISFSK